MNKFIVSENVEIVLDNKKFLLEEGDEIIVEKWEDAEIESTGEYADKTVEQLREERDNLKKRQENYKKKHGKANKEITEQLREVNFAIRAKIGFGDVEK